MKKFLLSTFTFILALTFMLEAQTMPLKREFRGAWVATVANIDWPSSRYASPGEQIAELVTIMDKLKESGMNAVFFQIRTECDALYNSSHEPWSYWLTGEQGKAPEPYYDPLEFAVREAHKRGMELHAWFNPYRAEKTVGNYKLSPDHVTVKHPEWILNFGNYKMLDPGVPAVKEFVLQIVTDVISRYDIDGIHFDDYFYPYTPVISNEDSLTYARYGGKFSDIHDWRRNNINDLMAKIYDIVKAVKPNVKFGISPFGIVQNHYAGTNGLDSYSVLYCDPLTWLSDKTIDYINPQLYWEIGHARADYAKLLPWWAKVSKERHLYIGKFSSRFAARNYQGEKTVLGDQLRMNRNTENVHGHVYFSAKSITQNYGGILDSMKNDWFKYPALPPVMEWKDNVLPNPVADFTVREDSAGAMLQWKSPFPASDGETASYYIIYRFSENEEININDPRKILHITTDTRTRYRDSFSPSQSTKYKYVITAVDKLHNESVPVTGK